MNREPGRSSEGTASSRPSGVRVGLAAAALLASKFGEGFAEGAGDSAWSVLVKLRTAVSRKFAGDKAGEMALAQLEAGPAEAGNVRQLAELLDLRLVEDPHFAAELTALVAQARRDPATRALIATATGQARQVNIAGDHIGDIHM
jgi:hypothetical protein